MTFERRATCAAVLPYALWMGLLFLLPATAGTYALRTVLTAFGLVAMAFVALKPALTPFSLSSRRFAWDDIAWGLAIGALVCFLWIFPERFASYRDFSLLGFLGLGGAEHGASPTVVESPYDPAVCGWTLTIVKLVGSALVIAPVEEIFFRSFLYRWLQRTSWTTVGLQVFDTSAFLWMVGLFALEHHTRLAAGAMAGALYGILAIRRGLGPAILAHVTTNLALGIYVIVRGEWSFW